MLREQPVEEKQARDLEFFPPAFEPLVGPLYTAGFTCWDWGVVFYVINKGQTGVNKVCSLHLTLDEAKAALEKFDPVLRPHTEIRAGLLIEGNPIHEEGKR